MVTTENLAVITLSTYGDDTARHCEFLLASCNRFGINLQIAHFTCETYAHDVQKLYHRLEYFKSLDARYEYILFIDGRDAFFVRPLEVICDHYNSFYEDELVIGAERISHPCHEREWLRFFPRLLADRSYINSGVFIGKRADVIQALELFIKLKENFSSMPDMEDVRQALESAKNFSASSEQVFWQIAVAKNLLHLQVDAACHIVANITIRDDTRIFGDNRDYIFDPETPLIVRSSGSAPAIIHVPAKQNEGILRTWFSYFYH